MSMSNSHHHVYRNIPRQPHRQIYNIHTTILFISLNLLNPPRTPIQCCSLYRLQQTLVLLEAQSTKRVRTLPIDTRCPHTSFLRVRALLRIHCVYLLCKKELTTAQSPRRTRSPPAPRCGTRACAHRRRRPDNGWTAPGRRAVDDTCLDGDDASRATITAEFTRYGIPSGQPAASLLLSRRPANFRPLLCFLCHWPSRVIERDFESVLS